MQKATPEFYNAGIPALYRGYSPAVGLGYIVVVVVVIRADNFLVGSFLPNDLHFIKCLTLELESSKILFSYS